MQLVQREVQAQRLAVQRIGRHLGDAQAAQELDLRDLGLQAVGCVVAQVLDGAVFGPQVQVDGVAGLEGAVAGVALQLHVADLEALVAQRHRAQHVDLAHEVGHEGRGWLLVDFHRRADLLDHAVVHHHDAVGHRQRFFLVVRDHDGRDADLLLQPADLAAQADALQRVERRKRFVQQQQAGPCGQRAGQGHALLLAARELARVLGARGRQADQFQQLVNARLDLALLRAAVDEAVAHVVRDRQIGKERVRLEHDAVVALVRRQPRDVLAVLQDLSGRLRFQARDDAQQRGLAAARGAEKAQHLARVHAQVHVTQRAEGFEVLVNADDLEGRGRCGGGGQLAANEAGVGHVHFSHSSLEGVTSGGTLGLKTGDAVRLTWVRPCLRSACSIPPGCVRGSWRPSSGRSWPAASRSSRECLRASRLRPGRPQRPTSAR